jgi:hypothetical protein
MDWRDLAAHRLRVDRGERFYLTVLTYAQYLWQRRFPARAILCIDRALSADLRGDETVLQGWPLPYEALAWLLAHAPLDAFLGNPRVHFQHYAGRMNEPRREQRVWRAWACWALTRCVRPQFIGDSQHVITEPTLGCISEQLGRHGHSGEAQLWADVYARVCCQVFGGREGVNTAFAL